MLLFFGVLYAGLSARPAPVKDGVLDLNLNGSVVEQPSRASWSDVAGGNAAQRISPARPGRGARQGADDDRVKAVALDLDGFTGGGQTAIGDLADAVRRVRASGKPVIAYGVGYTNDSYQLASAASEIWLNPLGGVLIAGPGGSNLYYKGLLDKLGVTANVYRVGTYKSAVEPYIRNDMSPEAKQNYMALDQAELDSWRAERPARPAQGECRLVPQGHERRGRGGRRRHGQGRAGGRPGRQAWRAPRFEERLAAARRQGRGRRRPSSPGHAPLLRPRCRR